MQRPEILTAGICLSVFAFYAGDGVPPGFAMDGMAAPAVTT
jgi:hypothetical protein